MRKATDKTVACPWCGKQGLVVEIRPKSVGKFCLSVCGYRAWVWKYELGPEEVSRYYSLVPKPKKKSKPSWMKPNAPCKKCGHPIYLRPSKFKQKKLLKAYYFTDYWWCEKCGTMYMDDRFRVLVGLKK